MDNEKLNGVILLYIKKKAFDSINHGILLNKIKKILRIELKWFDSYLSNREQ